MTTVAAYVRAAPASQRAALKEIRAKIRRALPRANEEMGPHGFPVYTDGEGNWIAGFAARARGPMFYLMITQILDRHEARLGRLRSGRSCVEWKASKSLSLGELSALADEMLAEAADHC